MDKRLESNLLGLMSGDWLIDPRWAIAHLEELDAVRSASGNTEKPVKKPMLSLMAMQDGVLAAQNSGENLPSETVAIVHIRQVITKYSSWYSVGSKDYASLLASLYANEKIAGIILAVDTPGGQASGTQEVYKMVAQAPKSVITLVDGLNASAGYYYTAASKAIYATQDSDWIGSIGTYAMYADWDAFYEKMGLKIHEIYADQSTEKNLPWRELFKKKDDSLIRKDLTTFNSFFLADVKAARGGKIKATKEVDPYKGGIFYAKEAQKIGLIDGFSNTEQAVSEVLDRGKTSSKKSFSFTTHKNQKADMSLINRAMAFIKGASTEENSDGSARDAAITALGTVAEQAQAQVTTLEGKVTSLTTERDTAIQSLATANAKITELEGKVTTLTTERDGLQAKVTALGGQPGAEPTKEASEKKVEGEDKKTFSEKTAKNSMNQAAAALGL
ncbi:hypothetical protein GVN20_05615 [Runella sp. CRIBMP]|uniref:S49 family peptidase n=1 Tax=Runella sp. CRIBMP TaxID=2683261 RepID=UPI0014124C83|nr:S49 family peptidase [Runella sp. CRIBMP]NBB18827.1 hypothetical protein [Runella sp. CRIBMP]